MKRICQGLTGHAKGEKDTWRGTDGLTDLGDSDGDGEVERGEL